MMDYSAAPLEDWMRAYYDDADIDMGSSGVADFSLRELRELTTFDIHTLDFIKFRDSPCTGRADLRAAIAKKWGNDNPDCVITTHGASEAIYVTLMTILEPGDHVIALDPAYHSYTSIPRSLGCDVSLWMLRDERGFEPDLHDLRSIVTPQTKAIVVNFPHNPTGVTLTESQLDGLIAIANEADAYLVWDAALADLVYDRPPLPDPLLKYSKTISIGTFSKAFGLPGMRFGWCQADPDLIARTVLLRDRITLSISPLIELIAHHVIIHSSKIIGTRLHQATVNRGLLIKWAGEHREYLSLTVPQGGVTTFPLLRDYEDTREFCKRLGEKYRLLLVPGLAFDRPARVRLGFGQNTGDFTRGLDLIARELKSQY